MDFKKRWIKMLVLPILAVFLLCGIGYRLFWINSCYPSPQTQTYGLHESFRIGGYTILFSDWKWADGDENPVSGERTVIAELTFSKRTADESAVDLTCISFESGAWGSQFDAELMFELNPDLESLLLEMDGGESRKILFPVTMIDQQFTAQLWNRVDERIFYIVLQYYPEKLRFECPVHYGD